MKIIQTIKLKVHVKSQQQKKSFGDFMVIFEQISQLALVFLMPISNMQVFQFFFHYKYQRFMFCMHRKSSYFSSRFFKECFIYITLKFILLTLNFLDFFPRFNSHFRLVQATLKSIIFVQNHQVIQHFYYNNAYLNDLLYFASARNLSLRKYINRLLA